MTLPELLIAVSMIGLIITVLSATVIVTMRQERSTTGRLSVAHAEQTVGLWLPTDLASADIVNTDPWATPCGGPVCGGIDLGQGSNVLMLSWTIDGVTTNVSYNFRPSGDGTYELIRVVCEGGSCTSQVLLRELPGPPGGAPFIPGVGMGAAVCQVRDALANPDPAQPACTRPLWVITVSAPLAADAVGESPTASPEETKDANRVIVTINGGGTTDGAGGGLNQVSITAGGTTRREIDANSLLGAPSLVAARSRCGGPVTLIVDESGSIGDTNLTHVKTAVTGFVDALIGTPVKVQIVQFDTVSDVQSADGAWHRYYDMTSTADVDELKDNIANLTSDGRTNWEDGLFRTFYDKETAGGGARVTSVVPETVIFFTDGIPNESRLQSKGGGSTADPLPNLPDLSGPQWGETGGSGFHIVAFRRAEYIASLFRTDVRLVGVGVGSFGPTVTSDYPTASGTPYRNIYEKRPTWTYQRRPNWTYESNADFEAAPLSSTVNFQKATAFEGRRARDYEARLDYERRVSGNTWTDIQPAEYYPNAGDTSNYRIRSGNGTRTYYDITVAEWLLYRSQSSSNFRDNGAVSNGPWQSITEALYDANNTTTTESDNFRLASSPVWVDVTPTVYDAGVSSTATAHKFRINTTPRASYTVTPTEYANLATKYPSPGAWTMGAWGDTTPAAFAAGNVTADANDGFRINTTPRGTWSSITQAMYDQYNTIGNESDWFRKTNPSGSSWVTTTQADFDLHETVAGTSDGYQKVSPSGTWTATTKAEYDYYQNGTSTERNGYRIRTDTNGVVTPDGYNDPPTTPRRNDAILAQLITGVGPKSNGEPSVPPLYPEGNGEYDLDKVQLASLFLPTDWATAFPKALKAIALGECGGTLTMQTREVGGGAVGDPFTYQNTWMQLAGSEKESSVLTVTTNIGQAARTFDYSIPGGQYVDLGVELQNFTELDGYAFDHWECRSGPNARNTAPSFAVAGGSPQWPGFQVRVAANEAVSCIQWVRPA